MSSGEARKGALQHLQLVQNLIERCLQLYLNKKEVVNMLLTQAKIDPIFTKIVWQKLEEENREFFKAYHVRLMLKNQILVFNALLEKQVEHMRNSSSVASGPLTNGSTTSTLHQIPSSYLPGHASFSSRLDSVPCNRASLATIDGNSSVHQSIQLGTNGSTIAGKVKASTELLSTENLNMGMPHGMDENDETRIKSDPGYSNNSEFSFFSEVHQIPSSYLPGHASFSSRLDSVPYNRDSLAMLDGNSSIHQSIQLDTNGSTIAGKVKASKDLLSTENLNMRMPHGMDESDETIIKSDPGYSYNSVHQIPSDYLPGHTSFSSSLDIVPCNRASLAMIDDSYSGHQSIQLGTNGSAIAGKVEASTNLLSIENLNNLLSIENLNMGMPHVMYETRIQPDFGYSNNSGFPFCSEDSNLEANLPVGDVTGGSFSRSELTGQPMNEPVLDFDLSTFGGFLTQNPRNLRFTDSINVFSQGAGSQDADRVDSYGGYLFVPSEANNFMDSPGGGI